MKTGIIILVGFIIFGGSYYLIAGPFSNTHSITRTNNAISEDVLVKTKWKQMGGFEKYTPDHLRLGCWSTALAQIMYYHKLKPFGLVSYTSRNGYVINEKIDSSTVQLDLLVNKIDSSTSQSDIDATAHYNYYAALAVQKDFGTDRYMNKLASSSLLEQHYKVDVERYISWRRILPYSIGKLENVLCAELDVRRPVFLHFSDLKRFGHSVVIDAYRFQNKKLMVHINQGQGGPQDGWYNFNGSILKPNDDALRVIYTFKPV